MPRLIVTEGATVGLKRCHVFLAGKSSESAERAGQAIATRLRLLQNNPAIGRPFDRDVGDQDVGLRELVISFGAAGYVALYRHDIAEDAVYLLAFRHQREAGY